MYNIYMKFTERFNEILNTSGKTQTQVALAMNVSKQTINDYKRGKTVPSIEILYALCKFFDVTADYLLGLSDY